MNEETITISKARYQQLLEREFKLSCLVAGGVDNWEGYHESLKEGGYFDEDENE